jgi:hypothetical protein
LPPDTPPKADVLKLCNLSSPFPGAPNDRCPTVLIDLTASEEELWRNTHPNTRKMVRQAKREGITVGRLGPLSEDFWSSFLPAYKRLLRRKRSAGALGFGQISELAALGLLAVNTSCHANGSTLSWHIYVRHKGHARLLSTISDINPARRSQWNNLVGRAHRLHHWQDILWFKSDGCTTYDFGGVYRGNDDSEQINIARFKTSFGGQPADTYDAVLALTLKGRIARGVVARMGAEFRAGGRP